MGPILLLVIAVASTQVRDDALFAALRVGPGNTVCEIGAGDGAGSRAPTAADRGSDGMHGVHPETVIEEMKPAKLAVASSEMGDRWFLLVFEMR